MGLPGRSWVRAASFTLLYLGVTAGALVSPPALMQWAREVADSTAQVAARVGGSPHTATPRWEHKFPLDLGDLASVAERKQRFVAALLPVVKEENRHIAAQRSWLVKYRRRFLQGSATTAERQRLAALVREYRLTHRFTVPATGPVPARLFEELLLRADTLPPSLVLAQAAIESGWGTSRFLREGNNLFGQWVTGDTPGVVPAEADVADYRVAAYDSVSHSVRSYLRNLNTHRAYRQLRRWRADLRAAGEPLDGAMLSAGLVRYSQRGEAYVEELREIIHGNGLERLDTPTVQLTTGQPGWGSSVPR